MTIDTLKAILLLSGINENLPIFATFLSDLDNGMEDILKNLLSNCEFCEN
jgi:hypothetical protein